MMISAFDSAIGHMEKETCPECPSIVLVRFNKEGKKVGQHHHPENNCESMTRPREAAWNTPKALAPSQKSRFAEGL